MRIFLTGATGYIGSAVLDALVRGGHDVTALVRDNGKARLVAKRGAHPVVGNLADPESYKSSAEAQDGYVHTAFDRSPGRGPEIEKAALEFMVAVAKRPRTSSSAAPVKRFIIYTSGVWVLGQSPDPADEAAPVNPIALTAWRPAHEQFVLGAATEHLRTIVVRPGVVYGGGTGMVADLFKSASNGLVRVVGDGNNHWPLVYDRDLADLYARLAANQDASGIYHANDEGDERVNDIVAAIRPYVSVQARRPVRAASRKRGRRWARTPTRWRSIRWCAARARARSAGRRRCTRWPATPRGCSKSGGTRTRRNRRHRN